MALAYGIHRQLRYKITAMAQGHGMHGINVTSFATCDEHPTRAQGLAVRYDNLKARLTALNSAPCKDMAAIDGVIALLAKTQLAFKATQGLIGNNPTAN